MEAAAAAAEMADATSIFSYVIHTEVAKTKKEKMSAYPCGFPYQNQLLSDTSPTPNPIRLLISPHSRFLPSSITEARGMCFMLL